MQPTLRQNKVLPDSFKIILRQYLNKEEVKSLAPDGAACTSASKRLLKRAHIKAQTITPVGKETDRRWEQGEDPSMIDSDIYVFEKQTKLVIADPSERMKWSAIGVRRLMRESSLSQTTVYKILEGEPVRRHTLSSFRQAVD